MSEKQMWKYVYMTLMEDSVNSGIYDAANGDKQYMYGVCHVMERIAYEAGVENDFYDAFFRHMEDSEAKAVGE